MNRLERDVRRHNLILHSVKESESNNSELLLLFSIYFIFIIILVIIFKYYNSELITLVLETLHKISKKTRFRDFDEWDISSTQRLSKNTTSRSSRPILVSVTLTWRKIEVLKKINIF